MKLRLIIKESNRMKRDMRKAMVYFAGEVDRPRKPWSKRKGREVAHRHRVPLSLVDYWEFDRPVPIVARITEWIGGPTASRITSF